MTYISIEFIETTKNLWENSGMSHDWIRRKGIMLFGLDGTAQWTRVLLKFELRDDVLSLAASEEIAGDPPADPTPASGSGTIPEESPEKRFERLRLRIVKKRRQQVIEQMERKLAGEKPAFRAEIPDFT